MKEPLVLLLLLVASCHGQRNVCHNHRDILDPTTSSLVTTSTSKGVHLTSTSPPVSSYSTGKIYSITEDVSTKQYTEEKAISNSTTISQTSQHSRKEETTRAPIAELTTTGELSTEMEKKTSATVGTSLIGQGVATTTRALPITTDRTVTPSPTVAPISLSTKQKTETTTDTTGTDATTDGMMATSSGHLVTPRETTVESTTSEQLKHTTSDPASITSYHPMTTVTEGQTKRTPSDQASTTSDHPKTIVTDGETKHTPSDQASTTSDHPKATVTEGQTKRTPIDRASTTSVHPKTTVTDGKTKHTTSDQASTTPDHPKTNVTEGQTKRTPSDQNSTTNDHPKTTVTVGETKHTASDQTSTTSDHPKATVTEGQTKRTPIDQASTTSDHPKTTVTEGQTKRTPSDQASTTSDHPKATVTEGQTKRTPYDQASTTSDHPKTTVTDGETKHTTSDQASTTSGHPKTTVTDGETKHTTSDQTSTTSDHPKATVTEGQTKRTPSDQASTTSDHPKATVTEGQTKRTPSDQASTTSDHPKTTVTEGQTKRTLSDQASTTSDHPKATVTEEQTKRTPSDQASTTSDHPKTTVTDGETKQTTSDQASTTSDHPKTTVTDGETEHTTSDQTSTTSDHPKATVTEGQTKRTSSDQASTTSDHPKTTVTDGETKHTTSDQASTTSDHPNPTVTDGQTKHTTSDQTSTTSDHPKATVTEGQTKRTPSDQASTTSDHPKTTVTDGETKHTTSDQASTTSDHPNPTVTDGQTKHTTSDHPKTTATDGLFTTSNSLASTLTPSSTTSVRMITDSTTEPTMSTTTTTSTTPATETTTTGISTDSTKTTESPRVSSVKDLETTTAAIITNKLDATPTTKTHLPAKDGTTAPFSELTTTVHKTEFTSLVTARSTEQSENNEGISSTETGNSRQSEAATTTTPVGHFFDINVDEPVTSVPEHCSRACPVGWTEGQRYCYRIPLMEKSQSYAHSISHCQALHKPHSNLADQYDYQDIDNLQLFKQMRTDMQRPTDLFYINMLASLPFRNTLKADIVSLALINRVDLHVVKSIGSIEKMEGVSAICRTTKFCAPNKCQLKQFFDWDKETVLGLPPQKELAAGESVIMPCIEFGDASQQTHTVRCRKNGEFSVHPSMLKCKTPENWEDEETETHMSPKIIDTCDLCYIEGTERCEQNQDGPGFVCVCRKDWKMRTCWKSPDFCVKDQCGEFGECINLGDHAECICQKGFVGENCEVNVTMLTWFGGNGTVGIINARTVGVAGLAVSNLFLLTFKWLTKIIKPGHSEDPQEAYQTYRLVCLAVANGATVFFTHPHLLRVDRVSCRFYYWFLSFCYATGLMFWVNESANVYQTVRAVHLNTWNTDLTGVKRTHMRFLCRVTVPFFGVMFVVMGILTNGWDEATTSWSCFGTFDYTSVNAWTPLLFLNAAMVILAFAFAEGTCYLQMYRPHTTVRVHRWFDLHAPAKREIVGKVERNLRFCMWGPFLHLITWGSLTASADQNTPFSNSISFFFCYLLVAFNFVQFVFTDPWVYGWLCVAGMVMLPKRYSPTMDWNHFRNRKEVLARYCKWIWKREEDEEIRMEDERVATERETIEKRNAALLAKYPGLPKRLQYHVPIEGPAVSQPRPYPFTPASKDYVPAFERSHMDRIWTRSYLDSRVFHKASPEKCAFMVIKHEIRRSLLRCNTEERRRQELYNLAVWWSQVPGMDLTVLRAHENTVIMTDPDETDVLAFERAVLKLASMISLEHNRKRRRLLDDHETDKFEDMGNFLKYEPIQPIKVLTLESVNGLGDVVEREFIKRPDFVLESQVLEFDKVYLKGVADLNIPFDKTYDDDAMFVQWKQSGYQKAAKEILNVQRSQIGRQRISMNPRKRPLDSFWFDSQRWDFVGPRLEQTIPIGPYESVARKCEYYQKLTDAEWALLDHNAYHLENLRKIRRGEL